MKKEFNPFSTAAYEGPEHFCDRKSETQQLINYAENGTNVTLFAIVRYLKLTQDIGTKVINNNIRKILYFNLIRIPKINLYLNYSCPK